jgi:hypothetical protein
MLSPCHPPPPPVTVGWLVHLGRDGSNLYHRLGWISFRIVSVGGHAMP